MNIPLTSDHFGAIGDACNWICAKSECLNYLSFVSLATLRGIPGIAGAAPFHPLSSETPRGSPASVAAAHDYADGTVARRRTEREGTFSLRLSSSSSSPSSSHFHLKRLLVFRCSNARFYCFRRSFI